jgi:hypothetical protein
MPRLFPGLPAITKTAEEIREWHSDRGTPLPSEVMQESDDAVIYYAQYTRAMVLQQPEKCDQDLKDFAEWVAS